MELGSAEVRNGRNLRPVLVVSTGRCGSTLLSNVLRLHPNVLSISEFFSMFGGPQAFGCQPLSGAAFWTRISHLDADLTSLLRCTRIPEVLADVSDRLQRELALSPLELVTLPHLTSSARALLGEIRQELRQRERAQPGEHIGQLFEWLRRKYARDLWVERSGGSIEYADWLRAQWPQAKFVCLVRDGRDTALSMAGHPMFRVRLARILSGCFTLPVPECLRAEIPLHRFGAYWSALALKADRLIKQVGAAHVVHYERLVSAPEPVLRSLAAFMTEREPSGAWLQRARALIAPRASRWRDLPRSERDALDAACRPGLRVTQRWISEAWGASARGAE